MCSRDIIIQKRMQIEDFNAFEFFEGIIADYGLKGIRPYGEIKIRSVCKEVEQGTAPRAVTNDYVYEMLVCDVMVAMAYERRTDLNFTEGTFVLIGRGMDLAKKRLGKIIKSK